MGKNQTTKNKILAAHHGAGWGSQGGAQKGTGARGEQYLDGPDRSHTITRSGFVLGPQDRAPKLNKNKNSLSNCPFFRSKRTRRLDGLASCSSWLRFDYTSRRAICLPDSKPKAALSLHSLMGKVGKLEPVETGIFPSRWSESSQGSCFFRRFFGNQ